jgi:hypothetical protein
MKTVTLEVTVTVPEEVAMKDLHQYVREAVDSWGGSFHPEDLLFGKKDTKVKTKPRERATVE